MTAAVGRPSATSRAHAGAAGAGARAPGSPGSGRAARPPATPPGSRAQSRTAAPARARWTASPVPQLPPPMSAITASRRLAAPLLAEAPLRAGQEAADVGVVAP